MTTRIRSDLLPLVAAVVLSLTGMVFLAGCDEDSLGPFEPEIRNETDTFQLQATDVRDVSLVREYVWMNTGTSANVNRATTVDEGSATLRIYDAADEEVYAGSLAVNGTVSTAAGESGAWTIRLVLADYSGTINFRAEAP